MKRYLISEVSELTGLEAHVLRYWEEELGLEIGRNELGHRYYTDNDIDMLIKAKEMKNKGFQLRAIKAELFGKADIIPIHNENIEVEKTEPIRDRDARMEQFKAILAEVISESIKDSNDDLRDKVVKEMDYLFRMNDEASEERFRKLDETIRACQKHGKEVAAGKEPRQKRKKRTSK